MAQIPPLNFTTTDNGHVAAPQRNDFFAPVTIGGAGGGLPSWVLAAAAAAIAFMIWRG